MSPFSTVIMIRVAVFESSGEKQLGFGYIFYNGRKTGKPEIFDFNGVPLPEDLYRLVTIDHTPVILPDEVQ